MPLRKIGVEAVVENLPGFEKALAMIEKMVGKTSASIEKSASASAELGRTLDSSADNIKWWRRGLAQAEDTISKLQAKQMAGISLSKSEVGQLFDARMAQEKYSFALRGTAVASGEAAAASSGLSVAMVAIGIAAAAVATAVAAVTAVIKTFTDLMQRGAALNGIIESFYALATAVGVFSQELLSNMRKAAAGAIADIDLMRMANLALTGVTKEVGKEFAESLPILLEFARKEAIATGESFEYLYDSLVKGIKRSSVRIIDNAGLVVRVSEANKKYAESVGKTVDQLTAQETQLALMRAVVEAARQGIDLLGSVHETAAIKMQRLNATVENTLNTLAAAVQPIFNAILDGIQPIFDFLSNLATEAAPYIQALAEMVANMIEGIFGPIGDALKSLSAGDLVKGFFTGGARIIGALAGGMAAAARATVIPVIKAIARAIASFLSGFSPPPEGPLHTIDIGGAKVMEAWLEGFMGVSLAPVERIAGEVASMMGNIGTASRQYVEARLKALDAAIQPFKDKLDIIRAQFDALKPSVDAAFSAIDRQMEKALIALNKGEEGSGAMVRALDRQRTALEDYVDAQQQVIDNAQVQLSLAEAQQAAERTMLNIRKRILGPAPKPEKEAADKAAKAKKGGGGGGKEDLGLAGGGFGKVSPAEARVNDLKAAVAGQEMGAAFGEGFNAAGGDIAGLIGDIADIQGAGAEIQGHLKRIGDKIRDFFAEGFDPGKIASYLGDKIMGFIIGLVNEIGVQLGGQIGNLHSKLTEWFTNALKLINFEGLLGEALTAAMSIVGLALGVGQQVTDLITGIEDWVRQGGAQTLITTGLTLLRGAMETAIKDGPVAWLSGIASGLFTNAFDTIIRNIVSFIVGPMQPVLTSIGIAIAKFIGGPLAAIKTAILKPIKDALHAIIAAIRNSGLLAWIPELGALLNAFDTAISQLGAAKGGLFSKGLLRVGEHGEELIGSASKLAVFPHNVTKMLDTLTNVMAKPMPMLNPAYSYANTYNNQRTMGDVNFNGVRGTDDAMRRYAILRAMGRPKR